MSTLSKGYDTLGADINKVHPGNTEGALGDLTPELTLDMKDEELIALAKQWTKSWEAFNGELSKSQDENEKYWLGKQFNSDKGATDNLIFESLETFLPIATRPKAEPVVDADNTEAGNALANNVRRMLSKKADDLSLNIKLKQVVRYWSLYKVGVAKIGFSLAENDMTLEAVRPQDLIMDSDAVIENCEYKGEYIGHYRKDVASNLIARFPNKAVYIKEHVKGKMGTNIRFIEWWSPEYMFWTLENEVLDKSKNPHWNYDTEQESQEVNDLGEVTPIIEELPGKNHFKAPKIPFFFLSIFNLGKHPVDDTSLIEQNKPLQDLINKRLKQIDNNADDANNGLAVSGDFFTREQAAGVSQAKRKGGTIYIPTGDVNKAVANISPSPLPNFIYESLIDYRNELRNIFGTRGSSPQGTMGESTVRGKIITKGQDGDRIGGGVSVFLEQFADRIFNYMVQMMMVYYDEPHTASVLGKERATEFIQLSSADFIADLSISVKEGSMIPTDPMTKRNEAVDLWSSNGIDPITFFDRLEFPNPRESAKQLYLWMSDPIQLFPDLLEQQQMQMMAQQQAMMPGQVPPGEIPPEQVEQPTDLSQIPIQ